MLESNPYLTIELAGVLVVQTIVAVVAVDALT
jgi:hypothetical protein